MSRWWAEPLELQIGDAALDATLGHGTPNLSGTQGAMASLQRQLSPLRSGARLRLILGDELVRYRVMPWNDALASPAAREALARHCLVETFGEAARPWLVRIDNGVYARHGAASLVCAIEPALHDAVLATLRERKLVLCSLQPLLMWAFNRVRQQIDARDHWFVLRRATGLTGLLVQDGQPRHVRTVIGEVADLAPWLDREWFSLGLGARRCPVFVDDRRAYPFARPAEPPSTGWLVRTLARGPTVATVATVVPAASTASAASAAA